jgi:hypothetical protein
MVAILRVCCERLQMTMEVEYMRLCAVSFLAGVHQQWKIVESESIHFV